MDKSNLRENRKKEIKNIECYSSLGLHFFLVCILKFTLWIDNIKSRSKLIKKRNERTNDFESIYIDEILSKLNQAFILTYLCACVCRFIGLKIVESIDYPNEDSWHFGPRCNQSKRNAFHISWWRVYVYILFFIHQFTSSI